MIETFDNAFANEDIEQNKVISLFAYIIFFIPLLAAKDSKFGRYHANQGLVLFLLSIAFWIVATIITSIIPLIGLIIFPLGYIGLLILAILGIVNALNGKANPLPIIGGISLIK
ncbi:MAG: hypothetical protein RO257_00950 [Candidatus Kapabacteria bacterium]|nr:hypothetical protein [Candidatus Kapabacteria bacterium]